uniref:Uncharacterized protein n=1 Tax=Cucumis sativus TaxID=3659 RepID=A0A0A0KY91_CUCSA
MAYTSTFRFHWLRSGGPIPPRLPGALVLMAPPASLSRFQGLPCHSPISVASMTPMPRPLPSSYTRGFHVHCWAYFI